MLDERLKRVAVIGAAGKMGSGIALLLLQEMARVEVEMTGSVGSGEYRLNLIDSNEKGLSGLQRYLRTQLIKYAERSINNLRHYYKDDPKLISNEEMIDAFVNGALNCIRLETSIEEAKGSSLIFEVIVEDIAIKTKVFSTLADTDAYFFTNTSSIPISLLNEKAGLNNRIIGYHFFNPPAIQRLLEIITYDTIDPELVKLGDELAKRLKKIVVHSTDVAGFVGNGHFIREIDFACKKVKELSKQMPLHEAVFWVNQVTQNLLLRPMGIFQLIDYVGIDVCQKIAGIMSDNLGETFELEPIEKMEILGGQNSDGSQKDGFFKYEKGRPVEIYSFEKKKYVPFPAFTIKTDLSWKKLQRDPTKNQQLENHFHTLFKEESAEGQFAQAFMINSRDIARHLVERKIAGNVEDVNTVLMHGFYHLYGPENPWIQK